MTTIWIVATLIFVWLLTLTMWRLWDHGYKVTFEWRRSFWMKRRYGITVYFWRGYEASGYGFSFRKNIPDDLDRKLYRARREV